MDSSCLTWFGLDSPNTVVHCRGVRMQDGTQLGCGGPAGFRSRLLLGSWGLCSFSCSLLSDSGIFPAPRLSSCVSAPFLSAVPGPARRPLPALDVSLWFSPPLSTLQHSSTFPASCHV